MENQELKTIEQWKKELLPQPRDPKKGWQPGEELGYSKDWLFNSAKIMMKWAVGEEVPKEDFEAALEMAANEYVRKL